MPFIRVHHIAVICALFTGWPIGLAGAASPIPGGDPVAVTPDTAIAARLFSVEPEGLRLAREDRMPPAWSLHDSGRLIA